MGVICFYKTKLTTKNVDFNNKIMAGSIKLLFRLNELSEHEPAPGYRARFVHTENLTFAFWDIRKGHAVASHSHPHEQVVKMLEGTLELEVEGEKYMLKPGLVLVIPSGAAHSAYAHTNCKAIDTFYPVREDYKKL